jgi:D-aminoacyl-tRNA deacylase
VKISFIYSTSDAVGRTIKSLGYKFEEIDEDITDFKYNKGDTIIVFSRHESSSKKPSITVHYPGNPSDKAMGGEPNTLGIAFPKLLTAIYRELKKINVNVEKAIEATHHGPTYQKVPVIFVEIGSSLEFWSNKCLVKELVESTLKAVDSYDNTDCKERIVGFGGSHYTPYFSKLADTFCIGHVISKYYIENLKEEVVLQVLQKSVERIDKIVFDNVRKDIRDRISSIITKRFNVKLESR